MSRERHYHGQKPPALPRRKPQHDPYTSKIIKHTSEREQDAMLRHAVRTNDIDTLDDWDEPEY